MDPHLAVRWLHVSAAMLAVGGAVLVATLAYAERAHREAASTVLPVAALYERVFWVAFGVLVATGVGNLGAFGDSLPRPESDWGRILSIKLALVIVLAVASAARTLLVVVLYEGTAVRGLATLRVAYLVTSVAGLAVVGLAEALAHA